MASVAIAIHVGIADFALLTYGFWNGWNIRGRRMIAWLSSTVAQVIAVGRVITKSLFPSGTPQTVPRQGHTHGVAWPQNRGIDDASTRTIPPTLANEFRRSLLVGCHKRCEPSRSRLPAW